MGYPTVLPSQIAGELLGVGGVGVFTVMAEGCHFLGHLSLVSLSIFCVPLYLSVSPLYFSFFSVSLSLCLSLTSLISLSFAYCLPRSFSVSVLLSVTSLESLSKLSPSTGRRY